MDNQMHLLPLAEIKELLTDRRLKVVGRRLGISYPTLKRLAEGSAANYSFKTLAAVSHYFKHGYNGQTSPNHVPHDFDSAKPFDFKSAINRELSKPAVDAVN